MQTTHQLTLLALAFALSSVIGFGRELRQKSAGLRTHTLVGVGAAGFILVSKYGFGDLLGQTGVALDPSRVAAQVVSGIGFIGAGVIFVRRHDIRGLTTAAGVWVCSAVGLAAGAGLVGVAIALTLIDLIVAFVYTPLVRRLPRSRVFQQDVEVTYRDGEGILRRVLSETTGRKFAVSDLDVAHSDTDRALVSVSFSVEGVGLPEDLAEILGRIDGVDDVRLIGGE
jgi:putative Mg2+ transporter-C (MgtC) family protein